MQIRVLRHHQHGDNIRWQPWVRDNVRRMTTSATTSLSDNVRQRVPRHHHCSDNIRQRGCDKRGKAYDNDGQQRTQQRTTQLGLGWRWCGRCATSYIFWLDTVWLYTVCFIFLFLLFYWLCKWHGRYNNDAYDCDERGNAYDDARFFT